jgi:hypothetical protein
MSDKNRKIILISLVGFLIVLLAVVLFFSPSSNLSNNFSRDKKVEFLNEMQKEFYGLDKETKAQAFYDEEGSLIYKIIKDDSDIISDPVGAGLKAKNE